MKSLNWISAKSLMSRQHDWENWPRSNGIYWIKIHPFYGFPVNFINIFPLKLFMFIWNTTNYFCVRKIIVASSQQVKCSILLLHCITVNTHCDVTVWMGKWSTWIDDIAYATIWHHNRLVTFSFIPNNHLTNSLTFYTRSRKKMIFYFETWI